MNIENDPRADRIVATRRVTRAKQWAAFMAGCLVLSVAVSLAGLVFRGEMPAALISYALAGVGGAILIGSAALRDRADALATVRGHHPARYPGPGQEWKPFLVVGYRQEVTEIPVEAWISVPVADAEDL